MAAWVGWVVETAVRLLDAGQDGKGWYGLSAGPVGGHFGPGEECRIFWFNMRVLRAASWGGLTYRYMRGDLVLGIGLSTRAYLPRWPQPGDILLEPSPNIWITEAFLAKTCKYCNFPYFLYLLLLAIPST